jgi:hypothetical protein
LHNGLLGLARPDLAHPRGASTPSAGARQGSPLPTAGVGRKIHAKALKSLISGKKNEAPRPYFRGMFKDSRRKKARVAGEKPAFLPASAYSGPLFAAKSPGYAPSG